MDLTAEEMAYLHEQPLARLATARPDGVVDVAPVGFELIGTEVIRVGGHDITKTIKYHNITRNPAVAIVVDDLASRQPWTPRGIKFHGTATIVDHDGSAAIEIHLERKWSWGVNRPAFDHTGPVQDRA